MVVTMSCTEACGCVAWCSVAWLRMVRMVQCCMGDAWFMVEPACCMGIGSCATVCCMGLSGF